jgi:hypothetical protein
VVMCSETLVPLAFIAAMCWNWMVQTTTTLRGPTLDAAIDAAKEQA